MAASTGFVSAGWFTEPTAPHVVRYWDGEQWTAFVATRNPASGLRPEQTAGIVHSYLGDMLGDGLPRPTYERLDASVEPWARRRCAESLWRISKQEVPAFLPSPAASRWVKDAPPRPLGALVAAPPASHAPAPPRAPLPPPRPLAPPERFVTPPARPVSPPVGPAKRPDWARPVPAAARVRVHPERRRRVHRPRPARTGPSWVTRFWAAVRSDMGVHGLAYLGVLLLFGGVTGFVVFAFGDVSPALRPLAELAIPGSLMASSWALQRRKATEVATALQVGAAALLPIVAIASLVDGAAIPPDLSGRSLLVTAAALTTAIAVAYGVLATRWPHAPVRFLAAPVGWLAAGLAGGAFGADAVDVAGRQVARLGDTQVVAMGATLALTAGLARWRGKHSLSRPTLMSSVGGIGVLTVLAVVTGVQHAWTPWLTAVGGLALVVALESVAVLLPKPLVGTAQAVGLGVALAGMAPDLDVAWIGAAGVVAYIALLELLAWRRPHRVALAAAALGALVSLALTTPEAWPAVTGFAAVSAWAMVRRRHRPPWLHQAVADLLCALAPAGIVFGLVGAVDASTVAVVVAATAAVLVVGLPAAVTDRFMKGWLLGATAAAVVVPLVAAPAVTGSQSWTSLAVAAGLAAVAVVLSPEPAPLRAWIGALAVVELGAFASASVGIEGRWQLVALGTVGAAVVFATDLRPASVWTTEQRRLLGHLGLVGHLAVIAALGAAPFIVAPTPSITGWTITALLGTFVAAWVVTSVREATGGSASGDLLAARIDPGRTHVRAWTAPSYVATLAAAPLVLSVLDSAGWLGTSTARAGLVLTGLGLVEVTSTRLLPARVTQRVALADSALVTAVVGAAVAVADRPWPAVATAGALTLTTLAAPIVLRRRYVTPVVGLGALLAVAAAGVPNPRFALGFAGVALVLSALHRWQPRTEAYERWWLSTLVGLAVVVPLAVSTADAPAFGLLAGSAGLGTAALLLERTLPVWVRCWVTALALVQTGTFTMSALDVAPRWHPTALAVASLVVLIAVESRRPDTWVATPAHRVVAHTVTLAFLGGLAALVLAPSLNDASGDAVWRGWSITLPLAAAVLGWLVVTARQATGGSNLVAALHGADADEAWLTVLRHGPSTLVAVGLPALALSVMESAGWEGADLVPTALTLGAIGLAYAGATRLLVTHPSVTLPLAVVSPVLGLAALAGTATPNGEATVVHRWPLLLSAVAMSALAVATAPNRRTTALVWTSWAATALVTLEAVLVLGHADPVDAYLPLLVWGLVAVLGALTFDHIVHGRRTAPGWTRDRDTLAPATLGLIAVLANVGLLSAETQGVWATWCLLLAAWTVAVAWLTATGAASLLSWSLATAGTAALVGFDPLDHPWAFVVAAAAMTAGSMAFARWQPRPVTALGRWDMAPLIVGTVTGFVGVAAAPAADSLVPTWIGAGGLALVIGIWRRQWPWAAAGTVLVNLGAAAADPGWLSASLAMTSTLSTAGAVRMHPPARHLVRTVGALEAAGSWTMFTIAVGWDRSMAAWTSALVAGGLVLAMAAAVRWRRLGQEWFWTWAGLGVGGVALAGLARPVNERWPAGGGLAGALVLIGLAFALAAEPMRRPIWREASVAVAGMAGLTMVWATNAGSTAVTAVTLPLSAALLAVTLVLYRVEDRSPWWRPLGVGVLGSLLVATVTALDGLPSRGALVALLAVAGAEAAAAGLLAPSTPLQMAAPVLLCGAWLAYASEALTGEALWFTVPIGLALLVVVEIIRHDRHADGHAGTPPIAQVVEYAGMGFLVVPPIVEGLNRTFGLVAVTTVLGVGLAGWGIGTKVRRRLVAGAASVVTSVIVMLGVPMSRIDFGSDVKSSPLFWLVIIGVGVLALLAAVYLEQGKAKVRQVAARISEATKDWE